MGIWRLYTPDQINQTIITGQHNLVLCTAAVFLAILAAMVLLPVTDRYHDFRNKPRLMWLAAGSIAMGTGIWAMFFTSVLALRLPFPVNYDAALALLAIVPAIIASGSCIVLYVSAGQSTLRLHQASLLLALGVGAMHYIGMEAIDVPAQMYYMPGLFILSVASAYAFSMVGLNAKLYFSNNPRVGRYPGTLIGAIILGLAVSSTHFVAMRATFFVWDGTSLPLTDEHLASTLGLFAVIAGITGLLFVLILIGSRVDRRLSHMAESLQQSETRFRKLAETTRTAIFTFDGDGVIYANPALSDISGYPVEDILRRPLADIFGEDFARYAAELLATQAIAGEASYRQFQVSTRTGESRWLYFSITHMDTEDGTLCLASAVDMTDREKAEQALHRLAYSDHLTGLANRARFMDALSTLLDSNGRQPGTAACVILVDLDDFSQVNDTFGHREGDELLKQVAARLQSLCREQDTLARLAGDEFAVLARSLDQDAGISIFADACLERMRRPFHIGDNDIDIQVSIGITALSSLHHKTPDLVMHETDIALHRAKQQRESRWVLYDDEIDAGVRRSRSLQSELKNAIEGNGLELYYQPIVDAQDHALKGFEALARWQRSTGEWVSPGEFIPLAEKSGLINDLELWALDTAMAQIDAWNRRFDNPDIYVSVNITADTVTDPRLHPRVAKHFSSLAIRRNQLKLELTERLLIDDTGDIINRLERLRALGCELMIDDFGTGYSSLSYLHKLPVQTLKIDRSFVIDLQNNDNSHLVVNSIIALSKSLKLGIISEGVETLAQSETLRDLGSNLLQGYLFCRPVDAAEAGEYLERECRGAEHGHLMRKPLASPEVSTKH